MEANAQTNNDFTQKHCQEWVKGSAVDPTLTTLNVRSLTGDEVYELLLYALPKTARRNDLRLRNGYLRRYDHTTKGAWWVSGLDPLNNWLSMDWGRIKPDYPRLEWVVKTPTQELALGLTASRRESEASYVDFERIPFPLLGADEQGRTKVSALRFFKNGRVAIIAKSLQCDRSSAWDWVHSMRL